MRRIRFAADDGRVRSGQLLDHRGAHVDQLHPQPRRGGRRRRQGGGDRGIQRFPIVADRHPDPELAGVDRFPRTCSGAVEHVPGNHCRRRVGRQDSDGVQGFREREHPVGRQPAVAGFEPDDTAQGGGNPYTATGVAAQGQREVTGSNRSGRTRRRAAGDAGGIVRIAGRPGRRIVTGGSVRELLGVQLGDDDGAGLPQPGNDRGVGHRRCGVGEQRRTATGR